MKTSSICTILAILFLIGLETSVYSQEVDGKEQSENSRYKNGLGLAAGMTSSFGLSYRRFIKKFGVQLTFAPITTTSSGSVYDNGYRPYDETTINLNTGFTFLLYLVEGQRSNLFAYQSNYYYYQNIDRTYTNGIPTLPPSQTGEDEGDKYWNHGLGFGIELIVAKKMSLNFMAGYGSFKNFESINFAVETGLYYTF